MKNKFSIITASFNSYIELEKTIVSILELDYDSQNLEYIVVDGGSKDKTKEILKYYEDKFKKRGISYKWISEEDKGIYDALNKGKKMVTEEDAFVICINAGDKLLNIKCLERITADIIIANLYAVVNGKNKKFNINKIYEVNEKNYFKIKVHHQSFFIRKKILEDYFIDIGETADNLLMVRAINNKNYKKENLLEKYTSSFTLGGISDQRNFKRIKSYMKSIKKYNSLTEEKLSISKLIVYNIVPIFKLLMRAILPNKVYDIRRRIFEL
ncbi:glycosyltransferase, group 2 family protein [Cetobacterium somerae ATCC BAA-474]|uniref:Glycosyltransferase, group 2 family protein n=1 Tax=Cetobacterium somerae ATCC BAA-474 TaxID=1319815 RepID=U7V5T8_9FUSO|nr:glycosyltransferase [Cetobacterium somerae]ERT66123.1 glycosyltransferase, group 2 family protein [Cetobacterium somerae ATCC BAA-474]